jgi:hypothetical protein
MDYFSGPGLMPEGMRKQRWQILPVGIIGGSGWVILIHLHRPGISKNYKHIWNPKQTIVFVYPEKLYSTPGTGWIGVGWMGNFSLFTDREWNLFAILKLHI